MSIAHTIHLLNERLAIRSEPETVSLFVNVLCTGVLFMIISTSLLLKMSQNELKMLYTNSRNRYISNQIVISYSIHIIGIMFITFVLSPIVSSLIKLNPFIWVFEFIQTSTSRLWIILYLLITVIFCGIIIPIKFASYFYSFGIHTRRKYFHCVTLIMFPACIRKDVRFFFYNFPYLNILVNEIDRFDETCVWGCN